MNIDRSSIHLLETSLGYCNDGIQLFSGRDFEGAIMNFANSLDVAKQVIRNPPPPPPPPSETTASTIKNGYGKRSSCVGHVDEDTATTSSEARGNLLDLGMAASIEEYFGSSVTTTASSSPDLQRQDSETCDDTNTTTSSPPCFFVYSKPIRPESILPQSHGIDRDHPDYDMSTIPLVLASVMIFNIALAYQMAASNVDSDDEQSKMLDLSRKLYELLLVHLQPLHPARGIFNIVILNNLSVIQKLTGNRDGSELTLYCLLLWIVRNSSSSCSHYSSNNYRILVDKILKNARNTITICDPQEETAPASDDANKDVSMQE